MLNNTDVTEFEFMDPDRVDAVHSPANGTPFLLLKSLQQEQAIKSCGDDACDVCSEKAKLKAKQRNALDDSAFAIPESRAYPIHDRSHAANALARVSQFGTPEEKKRVRAAVHRRYPDMGNENDDKSEKAVPSQDGGEAQTLRDGSVEEQESQTREVNAGRHQGAASNDNAQDQGRPKSGPYSQPRPAEHQGGGDTAPNKNIPKDEALSQTREVHRKSESPGAHEADLKGDRAGSGDDAKAKGEAASQGKARESEESARQKAGRSSQPDEPISRKAGAKDPDGDGDDDSTAEGDTDHDFFTADGKRKKQASKKAKPIEIENPDADEAKVAKRAKKALECIKELAAQKSFPLTAQSDIRQAAALLAGVTPRLDNFDKEFDDMTKEELIQLLDQREAARKEAKSDKKAKKAAAKKEAAKNDEAKKSEAKKADAGASTQTVEAPKGAEAAKSTEVSPDIAEIKKALGDIAAQVERIAAQPARPMPMLTDLSRQDGDKADPFAALKERFEKSTDPQEKAYLGGKLTELKLKNMERRGSAAYPAADTSRLSIPQDEGRTWIPGAARR